MNHQLLKSEKNYLEGKISTPQVLSILNKCEILHI